jgi:hypothetical protein
MIIRTCAGIKKNIQTSKKEYPNKSNSGWRKLLGEPLENASTSEGLFWNH